MAVVEVVVKSSCSGTGEGPVWEESTNSLLYVDILHGDIHRWSSTTGEDQKIHLPNESVGFCIPRSAGGLVAGLSHSIAVVDWNTETARQISEVEVDTRNRFNDGKCDASGRLWAGTMGPYNGADIELKKGALYSIDKNNTIKKHLDKIDISNGITWSADNRIMYYIDSIPRKVYAFDFDLTSGTISNQRVAVDFNQEPVEVLGFPDGMTIDTNGKLWIACYGAGKIVNFDPETGTLLQTIKFPVRRITSCCFGGPGYQDLYVTSCRNGLSDEEMQKTNQPLAGSVFKVSQLGVQGLASNSFSG